MVLLQAQLHVKMLADKKASQSLMWCATNQLGPKLRQLLNYTFFVRRLVLVICKLEQRGRYRTGPYAMYITVVRLEFCVGILYLYIFTHSILI